MPDWMANTRQMSFTPYASLGEATMCLGRFVDKALSPDIGIIWAAGDGCALIRKGKFDGDGLSYTVVIEWQPTLARQPPAPKPTFWQKLDKIFWDAMETEGEGELANAQAQLAMGQAVDEQIGKAASAVAKLPVIKPVVDFFGTKDGEHVAGMAFDVLGVLCFAALFVPGVGEAELGVVAAIRAGQVALTAGRATAGLAVAGTLLAARVDGTYLFLRVRSGEDAAKTWEDSPEATRESIAAAVLAIPDFLVGGAMLARDLATLPGRITAAESEAMRTKNQISGANQYIKKIEAKHGGSVTAGSRDAKKIAQNTARVKKLKDLTKEAEEKSQLLSNKLYVAMFMNAPSTFIGTPVGEAYFNHDNPDFWHSASRWVVDLLTPPSLAGRPMPSGNFVCRVGASAQTQTGN